MKFKLLLISCITLLEVLNLYSQKKVDSLLQVLKNAKHDSIRFNSLYSIGDELEGGNPDTSLYYYNAALKKADALKDELKKAKAIYAIGRCFEDKSDYAKALEYYNQSISITGKYLSSSRKPNLIKAKKILTSDYNAIGIVYMYQSDYSKTLDYFFKALKINDELKDKSGQAINYGNIGIVYYNQLNYSKALDYYFKALKINEELKANLGIK